MLLAAARTDGNKPAASGVLPTDVWLGAKDWIE